MLFWFCAPISLIISVIRDPRPYPGLNPFWGPPTAPVTRASCRAGEEFAHHNANYIHAHPNCVMNFNIHTTLCNW